MAIGLTNEEAGLAMRFSNQVNGIQRQAQSILDRQDATIDALRAKVRQIEAELDAERSKRKTAEFRLARSRFN